MLGLAQTSLGVSAEWLRCLDSLLRNGFVLLRDVPTRPRTVLKVAETFGFVRENNYGRLFDVRVVNSPNNLAFTSKAISPHTDNPYRDPVPTLQLLHCLENATAGGDTTVVEGFAVASKLRTVDPGAFEVLTRIPVTFSFSDATTFLSAFRPIIDVDPAGRIREVRNNNRSMQPGREHGPEFHGAQAPDHLVAAALLHDIGHLVANEKHHDTAKRYLCATEPGYLEALSPPPSAPWVSRAGP